MSRNRYTVAQLTEMKRLWQAGASSREICARFPELELTRNAVVGLAHRKGWRSGRAERPATSSPRKGPQQGAAAKTARTCQFPHGDPKSPDFRFCGKPAKTGKPYCAEHYAVCYRKPGEVGQ